MDAISENNTCILDTFFLFLSDDAYTRKSQLCSFLNALTDNIFLSAYIRLTNTNEEYGGRIPSAFKHQVESSMIGCGSRK